MFFAESISSTNYKISFRDATILTITALVLLAFLGWVLSYPVRAIIPYANDNYIFITGFDNLLIIAFIGLGLSVLPWRPKGVKKRLILVLSAALLFMTSYEIYRGALAAKFAGLFSSKNYKHCQSYRHRIGGGNTGTVLVDHLVARIDLPCPEIADQESRAMYRALVENFNRQSRGPDE